MNSHYKFTLPVLVTCVFSMISQHSSGQSYVLYPDDSLTGNAPFNQLMHFTIQQNNNSGNYILLEWEQISVNIPNGWNVSICDNGNCFTNLPLNGAMDTVFNLDYGMLSLAVNPGTITGTGIIQYAVWDISNPLLKDTLTWIISASGFSGIHGQEISKPFTVFPSIANSSITIMTENLSAFQYKIFNLNGKLMRHELLRNNPETISVADLPAGYYYLSILNFNELKFTSPFIIQR